MRITTEVDVPPPPPSWLKAFFVCGLGDHVHGPGTTWRIGMFSVNSEVRVLAESGICSRCGYHIVRNFYTNEVYSVKKPRT